MFLCPPVICRQAELQKAGRPPNRGKASGSETARLHHARRRRGGDVAARGARAAAGADAPEADEVIE